MSESEGKGRGKGVVSLRGPSKNDRSFRNESVGSGAGLLFGLTWKLGESSRRRSKYPLLGEVAVKSSPGVGCEAEKIDGA